MQLTHERKFIFFYMVNRFQFEADQYQIFAKYVFFGAAKTYCLTVLVNLLKLQDLCNCTLQMYYLILTV